MYIHIIITILLIFASVTSIYTIADQQDFGFTGNVNTYNETNWSDTGAFTISNETNDTNTTAYFGFTGTVTNEDDGGGWLPPSKSNYNLYVISAAAIVFSLAVGIKYGIKYGGIKNENKK